jgi:ATP-dependent Clp protease ATP-binding subunit ClpC
MTSNIGSEDIRKGLTTGFAPRRDGTANRQLVYRRLKENLLSELRKAFRPEFLNRVDAAVIFDYLSREQVRNIVDLMLARVGEQLNDKNVKLEVTEAAKDFLGEKGYDEVYGARPLRRVIQDLVEDKLSDDLLRGKLRSGDTVVVDLKEGQIVAHPPVASAVQGG